MSDDRNIWEVKFVDTYVTKPKRSRYKTFLCDPRKRGKILGRLNHNADLDFSRGIELAGRHASPEQLIQKLSTYKIEALCWLMSHDSELDGKLLPMREAAELTAVANWGTIMICPPKPIAVYRAEPQDSCLYLFC